MTKNEILKTLNDALDNWSAEFDIVYKKVAELETKSREILDVLKNCMDNVEIELGAMHARINDPKEGLE